MQVRTRVLDRNSDERDVIAFYHRYQRLYIGAEVARALMELAAGWTQDADAARRLFAERRRKWESTGGYIEQVALDDVRRWMASGAFRIAEVAAPGAAAGGPFTAVAQRMLQLPVDGWAVPLLQEPADEIFDRPRYEAMLNSGWTTAAFADYWGALPEWSGMGLAAEARYTGMQALIQQNESLPPDSQLSCLVGIAFAVQGLEVLGGPEGTTVRQVIRLSDFGEPEVANKRSLLKNSRSKRSPGHIVGKLRPASGFPVMVDGVQHSLRVDWYYYIHFLHEVAPPVPGEPAATRTRLAEPR